MNSRGALSSFTIIWLAVATLVYTSDSVDTVLRFAPHALYADQWRQYIDYVTLPFPANIFHPDNGHRLVLPNFIAWLEILWFSGNQSLQIAIGLLCGLAAAAVAASICLRDREMPWRYRTAAMFLCFLAIFWLANVRTLFHSTELLHTKLPMFCLVAALALCMRAAKARRSLMPVVAALVFAMLATFSFGYGLSVFVGMFAVLVAIKADGKLLAASVVGLAVAAALYLALPGSDGVRNSVTFSPIENVLTSARWLGAPFVTMFSYLWDPNVAALLPECLQSTGAAIARSSVEHLPDFRVSVVPQALFGGFGMIALIAASLARLSAQEPARPTEALGLGIAWYGLGAAGIVSLSRLVFFREHPEQIYADRYLCWPCLFWLGLALVALGRRAMASTADGRKVRSVSAQITFACALAFTVCAWPTQKGGSIYAALVRGHVDNMAVGSLVGVFPRNASTGETNSGEYVHGVPILATHHIAQFADPIADEIGHQVDASSGAIADASLETSPVADNLLGDPGAAVTVRFAHDIGVRRVLIVDQENEVVGAAVENARLQPPGLGGYVRGMHTASDLRVVVAP